MTPPRDGRLLPGRLLAVAAVLSLTLAAAALIGGIYSLWGAVVAGIWIATT